MALALKPLAGSRSPHVTVEAISPATAATYLTTDRYHMQRRLREWHVSRLADAMMRGEFVPEAIQFCRLGKDRFLVDGQHRLAAVVRSETTQTFPVIEYDYDTLEEVDAHYGRIGAPVVRTMGEAPLFQQFGASHDLAGSPLRGTLAAISLLADGFEPRPGAKNNSYARLTLDQRYEILCDWEKEITRYWEIARHRARAMQKEVNLAATIAVALVTFRYQKEKAPGFWEQVFHMVGYEEGSGPYHLVAHFKNRTRAHTVNEGILLARTIARCWALFYEGETTSYLKSPQLGAPIRIAGTPYDGRVVKRLFTPKEMAK